MVFTVPVFSERPVIKKSCRFFVIGVICHFKKKSANFNDVHKFDEMLGTKIEPVKIPCR